MTENNDIKNLNEDKIKEIFEEVLTNYFSTEKFTKGTNFDKNNKKFEFIGLLEKISEQLDEFQKPSTDIANHTDISDIINDQNKMLEDKLATFETFFNAFPIQKEQMKKNDVDKSKAMIDKMGENGNFIINYFSDLTHTILDENGKLVKENESLSNEKKSIIQEKIEVEEQLKHKDKQIAELDNKINRLNTEINSKNDDLEQLNKNLIIKTSIITTLQQENESLENKLKKTEEELQMLEQKHGEQKENPNETNTDDSSSNGDASVNTQTDTNDSSHTKPDTNSQKT
ncbi:MAG: hypothetical protein WC963_05375 [Bacilli bacterium]|jgi:chromosome segregation ATPase